MSDLQHPMKRELDKVSAAINEMQQAYNLYFQGLERLPPLKKRADLEEKVQWLRTEVQKKNNASLTFLLRQLDARFQLMRSRWDKTMSEIESGAYRIPIKRK